MSFTRSVLITGGTSGLGYHCALNIARQHPEYLVVVASRNDPTAAAELINETLGQKNVLYLPLDLSSLAKVRSFAANWAARNFPPIQALLLNAGMQYSEQGVRKTGDGIETSFGVNHVGHALLFYLLLPHLASSARIVITSSGTHDPAQKTGLPAAIYNSAEELAHPTPATAKYHGRQRYTSSKLANVLFTYALHRRAQKLGRPLTVVAFDPGLMPGTGLARDAAPLERWLWTRILPRIIPLLRLLVSPNIHTPQDSGATLAWLAVGDEVEGASGVYYEASPDRKTVKSSRDSYDEGKQEDLWEWTVQNVAVGGEERRSLEALA